MRDYYFMFYWYRQTNANADPTWHPDNMVTERHPLEVANAFWRRTQGMERVLGNWRTIPKEEYDLHIQMGGQHG